MKGGKRLRTVFFGTPPFVTHVLDALFDAGLTPTLTVTASEKPQGRGLLPKPSAVKVWAQEHGVPVWEPEKIDEEFIKQIKMESWDVFIVAGYGKILPQELLDIPKHGTLNVHPSLLPKFRGPSPIESQILLDTKEIGVSVILLDQETDHGPILAQASFTPEPWPIKRRVLEELLWKKGGEILAETIPSYIEGKTLPTPQNHNDATFTPKLSKEDGLVDLSGDAYKNYLKFCAYEGWPGTYFFTLRNGIKIRVKIAAAEFANGEFRVLRVIPEGKKEMDYTDFLRA